MSDEHEREAALNHFWNALIGLEQHAHETDLTPEEIAVVRRLHRVGAAPRTGLSAEAAWPQVLARIEATRGTKEDPMFLTNAASVSTPSMLPNGRGVGHAVPPHGLDAVGAARRWSWGQTATAALLLLTLVSTFVAFGRMRGELEERPASLPAVLVATPSPETAEKTLVSTILPAEMIPTALGNRTFNVWHVELEPGTRVPVTGQLPGPQITHILAGELTLRVDGSLKVVRGGGIVARKKRSRRAPRSCSNRVTPLSTPTTVRLSTPTSARLPCGPSAATWSWGSSLARRCPCPSSTTASRSPARAPARAYPGDDRPGHPTPRRAVPRTTGGLPDAGRW